MSNRGAKWQGYEGLLRSLYSDKGVKSNKVQHGYESYK